MVSSRISLSAALQLSGATGAVSCVGAFGTDTFMEKVCGDASVTAVEAAEQVRPHRQVYYRLCATCNEMRYEAFGNNASFSKGAEHVERM